MYAAGCLVIRLPICVWRPGIVDFQMFQHIRCCLEGPPANLIQSYLVVAVVACSNNPSRITCGCIHTVSLRPIAGKVPFHEASLGPQPMRQQQPNDALPA